MENKLGEYIRKRRGKESLRSFAKKIGISYAYLDNIEKGYDRTTKKPNTVTIKVLTKIANGLNTTVNDLLVEAGVVDIPKNIQSDDYLNYILYKSHNSQELRRILAKTSKLSKREITMIENIIDTIIEEDNK